MRFLFSTQLSTKFYVPMLSLEIPSFLQVPSDFSNRESRTKKGRKKDQGNTEKRKRNQMNWSSQILRGQYKHRLWYLFILWWMIWSTFHSLWSFLPPYSVMSLRLLISSIFLPFLVGKSLIFFPTLYEVIPPVSASVWVVPYNGNIQIIIHVPL